MRQNLIYSYTFIMGLFVLLQPLPSCLADQKNISPGPLLNMANVPNNLSFAIMDHDYVMQESTAAQQARIKIDQQRTSFQEEINKCEQKLRDCEVTLVESQRTLNESEYSKQQREYEFKFSEIQRKFAERRHQLEESFNKAREIVVAAILKISSEIAEERSLEFILPRSIILYAKKDYDITDEVLIRLNKLLPEVNLDIIHKEIESAK